MSKDEEKQTMIAQDETKASLALLYHISRELARTLDLPTVLTRLLMLSIENVGAERGTIVVLDEKQEPVHTALVYGDQFHPGAAGQLNNIIKKGLAGWVIRNLEPALIQNTLKDERWLKQEDDAEDRTGAKSAICVPIMHQDNLTGVLTIVHPVPNFFTQGHFDLIQTIADQAGMVLHIQHPAAVRAKNDNQKEQDS